MKANQNGFKNPFYLYESKFENHFDMVADISPESVEWDLLKMFTLMGETLILLLFYQRKHPFKI